MIVLGGFVAFVSALKVNRKQQQLALMLEAD